MKKIFLVTFSILVAALLVFVACPTDNTDDGDPNNPNNLTVDFTSHNTNYSIRVRNYTGERLVAFKGELRAEYLLGGIPAHAENHSLAMNLTLFAVTEAFPMILITEAQYNANKNNLNSLRDTPFTRVFVFYNKTGDNSGYYEISDKLGGNNTLSIMNNSSTINVELRVGGTAGETLGYAQAGILESKFRMQNGNYSIFPVFRRYNEVRDVVTTVYPKRSDGAGWRRTFSFGEGVDAITINLQEVLSQTSFTLGAAWVVVNNQTSSGGIRFVQGTQVQTTATGLTNIMTNRTFQINMPNVGSNFAESITVANWQFGPDGDEIQLQAGENDSTPVTSMVIEQNKMYTITVTGSADYGTLKAYLSNTTDIPTNEIGGN